MLSRPALPTTEDTLSAFVASLAKEGVSYTSQRVCLIISAVQHHQIENGQGDPGISRRVHLEYILKVVKRDGAYLANPRKERQPITPALLKELFTVWEGRPDPKNSKMLWAASYLAFLPFCEMGNSLPQESADSTARFTSW